MATFSYLNRTYSTSDYVLSPSNRVIKRLGHTCRRYLTQGYHIDSSLTPPRLLLGDHVTHDNKIRNPLTNRFIIINSRVYRNLINNGWLHFGTSGFIQPDGFTSISLSGSRHDMENQLSAFLADNESFPLYLASSGPDRHMVRIRGRELHHILGALAELKDDYDDDQCLNTYFNEISNNNNPLQGYFVIIPTNQDTNFQFLAATTDGFCVKQCLQNWDSARNWDFVPDYCGPDEMKAIVRTVPVSIQIYTCNFTKRPLYVFEPLSHKNKGKVCTLYYQFNHCLNVEIPIFSTQNSENFVFHDTSDYLQNTFNSMITSSPVKSIIGATKDDVQLLGFCTPTECHKVKFDGYESVPHAWTTVGAALKLLMESIGTQVYQTRIEPLMYHIVNPGITYQNGGGKMYYYDMKRAYASYKLCPYYSGFPDPTVPSELIHYSLEALRDKEGFALIRTELTYPNTCFEQKRMWAPFPQVRYALERNERFKVRVMLVCERYASDPFEHVKATLGEKDKSWFHKLIGRIFMHRTYRTAVATSTDELSILIENGYQSLKTISIGDRKMWLCMDIANSQQKLPEYPFLAAYVHGYQKITMFHDVVSKIEANHIKRIWIDGVGLAQPLDLSPPSERWKPCEERHFEEYYIQSQSYEIPRITCNVYQYDPYFTKKRLLILGPPGSGKTYAIRNYYQDDYREVLITASTNIAALNADSEAITTHKMLANHQKKLLLPMLRFKDRIIVDEFTMLSQQLIEEVLQLNYPVLFTGDFAQLTHRDCPTIDWFRDHDFEIIILNDIKRTTDSRTRDLYEKSRHLDTEQIIKLLPPPSEYDFPRPFQRKHYIASTNYQINRVNQEYCQHLGGKIATWANNFIAPLSLGMLVIGTNNERIYKNQEVGWIQEILNDSEVIVKSTVSDRGLVRVSLTNLLPGFAITFHRCQGQTFDFPIYVSLTNLFDAHMLYTAITRVTDIQYLCLVH